MTGEFSMRWIGQGGYALRCNGREVFIDPYLSNLVERLEGLKRLVPPPFLPHEVKADFFLVTHDHIDHLDTDLISAMPREGVRFLCPESCVPALLALGVAASQITVLRRGGALDFDGFSVEAHYANHTPDSVGYCVACNGMRLYVTGDTLYDAEVGANARADVICCCINGRWGNMNAAEAVEVALRSGAALAIPNHYGMFAENTADPAVFMRLAHAKGLRSYAMAHDEKIDLAHAIA